MTKKTRYGKPWHYNEYIELSELRGFGMGWSDKTKLDSADLSLQLLFTALDNATEMSE